MSDPLRSALSKSDILAALARLDELLRARGMTGELCLDGGTVMVLVFNARISTRDVDAVFQPASLIRDLAREISQEMSLPEAWLNDGVKGFLADRPETTTAGLPQFANLRLFRPIAEYLLAMKCLASRMAADFTSTDQEDILSLVRELRLVSAEAVLAIVERFYRADRLLPKTQFMIHEVISMLRKAQ